MMQRRTFLAVGGGLVAAAALPSAATPPRPPLRKAVKFEMIAGEAPILHKMRLLKELGFDGVEMPAPAAIDADEVLAACDRTGIVIHGVVNSEHWRSPLSDSTQTVIDGIAVAEGLGSGALIRDERLEACRRISPGRLRSSQLASHAWVDSNRIAGRQGARD